MSRKKLNKKRETNKEIPKKRKLIVKIKKKKKEIPELRSFNSCDFEIIRRRLNQREDINLPSPQSSKIPSEEEFPPLTPEKERRSTTRSTTRAHSTAWNKSYQASSLEAHSSPAKRRSISQLDPLSRETSTVHSRPPTPFPRVDTINNNTEINSSPNPFSTEHQDTGEEKMESKSSAQSGSSPGGSDNDSNISSGSHCPFNQDSSDGYNDDSTDPPPPPPPPPPLILLPLLKSTSTTSKMATFDPELEDLFKRIMKYELSAPLALAVHGYSVKEFEHFRSLEITELSKLTIPSGSTAVDKEISKINAKALTKVLIYALFMEDSNHADFEDPKLWDLQEYQKWSRQGPAQYLIKMNKTISAVPSAVGLSSAPFVPLTQQQRDDDAALVSWNRKPRDLSKYPIIKDNAGYQDFGLKFKRQLIEDKLSRVTDSTFTITGCRTGSDEDLANLQVNFFAQILSAVLQNSEGKGLVTMHPDNPLYVWKQHEAHQLSSDSAQIGSTTLMTKLISLRMTESSTRHEFFVSFQDTCNRYDSLAGVSLSMEFKRTLLQKAIMHDTALLNSWNTVNEVKRAMHPGGPPASYDEFYNFLMKQSKIHDIATPYKRSQRHANQTRFDTFEDGSNSNDNDEDNGLNEFIANMSVQDQPMSEEVVSALNVFSTFQRRRNGPARQRDPESEIPQPLYSEVSRELKSVWSREDNKIKKRILQCKQQVPKKDAKKNSELGVYMMDSEGYASDSDASAYSDSTYVYGNDETDDATGETSDNESNDLTIHTAASRQRRPPNGGILKKRNPIPKKTDLSVGDPRRFFANKQLPYRDENGKVIGHITYAATMARLS
jgi:hypothetical protein